MTPQLGLAILEAGLKWGPEIGMAIARIFAAPTHSLQDWIDVFDKVKTYEQMDAESKVRVGAAPAVPGTVVTETVKTTTIPP